MDVHNGKDHLGQMYFTFTAGFVRFYGAAEAPEAKSESVGHLRGFLVFFPFFSLSPFGK